jgi:hypothetical protein
MKTVDALALYDDNCSTLAKAIGYSRQAVRLWGEYVPQPAAAILAEKHPGKLVYDAALYLKLAKEGRQQRSRSHLKRWKKKSRAVA